MFKNGVQLSWKTILFFGILGLIALPTVVLLLVGCMPSIIAFFVEKTKEKYRVISVCSLNVAACSFYVLKLWMYGHTFSYMAQIITDPTAIIVMYLGAAMGYLIDFSLSGTIGQILYASAKSRLKDIENKQLELRKRWGIVLTSDTQNEETADQ